MAGLISFTGLSSDQDFNSIIDALVEARRTSRIQPLENWKTQWESKVETIDTVDSALAAFFNTVRGMDRVNELMARTAASTDTGIAAVTAASTAAVGAHTLVVNQLAQAETQVHWGVQNGILYHSGVSDQTTAVNTSGSDKAFVYSYGGVTRSITVSDGQTLQDLRDTINADAGNPGVTAKIVTTGALDHLVLTEDTPDGSKAVLIDPAGDMTLDGSAGTVNLTSSSFTQTVNASGSDKVLQFRYGDDEPVDITVPTGTTLEGLKDLINNRNAGVRAYILDDGEEGSGSQHLVLTGKETGADFAIALNPSGGTTLDGSGDTEGFSGEVGVFTRTAAAQNAQVRIDGYPPGGWLERSSNHISNLIEGLNLDLGGKGEVTLTIGTDNQSIMDKVEAFRESFNNVRSAIKTATAYDADTGQAANLLGNYAMQIVKARLDNLVSTRAPGFLDPEDIYSSLQQLGFSTDAQNGSETEGLLLLDEGTLNAALDRDPDAVAAVFSAYFSGVTDDSRIRFTSSLPTATAGIYSVEVDTETEKGRFKLSGGEWGDWVNLAGSSGAYTLTGRSGPERGIALSLSLTSGNGTYTAQLKLQNGVITEVGRELEGLLSDSGPLSNLRRNYGNIIDNIDARTSQEEARLTQYEERLKKQYARLDTYISRMNQVGDYLTAFANSTSNSKK